MGSSPIQLPDDRVVVVSTLDSWVADTRWGCPFAVMLPAYDEIQRTMSEREAQRLIDVGCVDFCCAGPEAETLHDRLDALLESQGRLDAVTTWHVDERDACEYFLFAAGATELPLLALVGAEPRLRRALEAEARAAQE
ncbi:MAG: hypothetical protein ACKVPX_03040 [Myxococcaceae bacterium]